MVFNRRMLDLAGILNEAIENSSEYINAIDSDVPAAKQGKGYDARKGYFLTPDEKYLYMENGLHTHGKNSHAIKHLKDFNASVFDTLINKAKEIILQYFQTKMNEKARGFLFLKKKSDNDQADGDVQDQDEDINVSRLDDATIQNTLDLIQDKRYEGKKPIAYELELENIIGSFGEEYAKAITKLLNVDDTEIYLPQQACFKKTHVGSASQSSSLIFSGYIRKQYDDLKNNAVRLYHFEQNEVGGTDKNFIFTHDGLAIIRYGTKVISAYKVVTASSLKKQMSDTIKMGDHREDNKPYHLTEKGKLFLQTEQTFVKFNKPQMILDEKKEKEVPNYKEGSDYSPFHTSAGLQDISPPIKGISLGIRSKEEIQKIKAEKERIDAEKQATAEKPKIGQPIVKTMGRKLVLKKSPERVGEAEKVAEAEPSYTSSSTDPLL